MPPDDSELETENRLRCHPCDKIFSRSDSLARHLGSKGHLTRMRGKVREVEFGRPTNDAARKKDAERKKNARERRVRRIW